MRFVLFVVLSFFMGNGLFADSFAQSKKILQEIYTNNQVTFYCGCAYTYENQGNMIERNSCGYVPRNPHTKKGDINERARRIEWEHVMPAENFGKHLPCWREGGRKACQKDPTFQKMEADMMNLVPAIGELNGDRSNYRYGADKPQIGQYGKCEFQVDFKNKRAYVRDDIKGDIARIYFYMSKTYNIYLSKQERAMMAAWDKIDPISKWEIEKAEKLKSSRHNLVQTTHYTSLSKP